MDKELEGMGCSAVHSKSESHPWPSIIWDALICISEIADADLSSLHRAGWNVTQGRGGGNIPLPSSKHLLCIRYSTDHLAFQD